MVYVYKHTHVSHTQVYVPMCVCIQYTCTQTDILTHVHTEHQILLFQAIADLVNAANAVCAASIQNSANGMFEEELSMYQ
jgi:hypothetical protein